MGLRRWPVVLMINCTVRAGVVAGALCRAGPVGRTYGGLTGPVSNMAGRQQGKIEQQPLCRSARGCLGMWRMSKDADPSDLRPLSKHVLRPGNVRYFAFGSNVNPTVMEGMRGMRPIASEAAYVQDYRLAFNLMGLPGVEPSFASIEPQAGHRVHGLVYTLCRSDWRRMTVSEGVGAAYALEPVVCETYSGTRLEAISLRTRPGLLRSESDVPPSGAYMGIIIEGATKARLAPQWIAHLKGIPTSKVVFDSRAFSRYYRTGPS